MSRGMHILMLSDVYYPRVNGVSTSIHTFRHDLTDMGHRVRLVVPSYGKRSEAFADRDITRIAGWPVPRDPEDRLMQWPSLRRKLAELATERWDVVHVHTPFLAHSAGVGLAVEIGAPLVLTCHTLFEECLQHYVPVSPRAATRALARRVSCRQYHQADAVIAPSRAVAERLDLYGVPPPLVHVLPTGLPADIFNRGDGVAFRHAHDIAPDRPLALFVGRISHEKNIAFLLEAMRTAQRLVPDAILLVAGDGPGAESLRWEARQLGVEDHVRFLGYVSPGKALADCYAAADVFAFAGRTETQGLVLLEAMAQSVPVLALAEMGTREILEGCPGALIGRDNTDEFGRQLAELLAQPERRRQLGAAARQWAQRWRGPALAQRLIELYQALPRRHRPKRRTRMVRRLPGRWSGHQAPAWPGREPGRPDAAIALGTDHAWLRVLLRKARQGSLSHGRE